MSPSDWRSGVKLLRMLAVAMAAALGALFAVGCLIGAVFEAQGFGRPAEDARPTYVAYSPSELTRSCVTRWSGHRCGGGPDIGVAEGEACVGTPAIAPSRVAR